MANFVQSLAELMDVEPSFVPQSLTVTGAGTAVSLDALGSNFGSALLTVGAVNTLTSLDVKIQASPDGSGSWVDVTGATFTQVTAANASEIIDFQVPTALNATSAPYTYVRAYATLVGTSALIAVTFLGSKKYDGAAGFQDAPPVIN